MRINSRLQTLICFVTCLAGSAGAGGDLSPSPALGTTSVQAPTSTSVPATQPAGVGVRGQVSIAAGIDLQRPDLSHVVIYIGSDPVLDALPLPAERPTVAQKNKQFVPNFVVVRRLSEVEFPNWDHFDHNVFSRSKAAPAFDLNRYPYGQSKMRQFDKLGVVQVFCNVHPSMRAIIFVTPNACFSRADADGHFEIPGVPPGHYELVVWHERCQEQRKSIDVPSTGLSDLLFKLEPSRKSILSNDPPEKRGGYGVERGLGVKRERLDLPVVEESHPAPSK